MTALSPELRYRHFHLHEKLLERTMRRHHLAEIKLLEYLVVIYVFFISRSTNFFYCQLVILPVYTDLRRCVPFRTPEYPFRPIPFRFFQILLSPAQLLQITGTRDTYTASGQSPPPKIQTTHENDFSFTLLGGGQH